MRNTYNLQKILLGPYMKLVYYMPLIYVVTNLLFSFAEAEFGEKFEYLKCGKFKVNDSWRTKTCTLDLYHCEMEPGTTYGYCQHDDIFPMTSRTIIGSIVTGFVVGFANAGGAGGGFLIVPLILGFFNYSLKESIEVSYIMVFGGTIGNYAKFGTVRHEFGWGPQVNYDLAMMHFPLLAVGSIYGETYKEFFSDPIIGLLEGGLLVFAGWRCWVRL